jgi:PAS domain S-box-containing protein
MLACCAGAVLGFATAFAAEPPPVIGQPTEVFWGSYRRNQDLVDGGQSGWSTVRNHLDGFLLHGAYWNSATNSIGSPSPDVVGPKLAALLNEAGTGKVILEHGLAGRYPDVESAFGTAAAGSPTAAAGFSSGVPNIKRLMSYGFPLPEISTDYIMDTWKQSVRMHPSWTSKEFFTALCGSWETYDGSQFDPATGDRATYGWFRQWVEGLAAAFPDIRVTSTNSPVYFNWDEGGVNRRELGGDQNNYFTWLKLERRGEEVSAHYSGDGKGWQALGSAVVPLGSSPIAGMFTASLDSNSLAQARFDNVRVLPCYFADVGKTGLGGSLDVSASTYTLKGRGNEALHPGNNTTDALFCAWRDWTGDGTFTIRLDSLTNSNTGRTNPAGEIATAGLTIRESMHRDARQISLVANFANQLEFLARTTTGGGLAPVSGSGSPLAGLGVGTAPRWLRITRSGNTFAAHHSLDGLSWTACGSVTVDLPPNVRVGLLADSQVRWEEATAVFSNVSFLTPLTASFSGSNLGSAGTGATSSLSGSTYTLKARGTGLAGTADAARLHATPLAGDGTLVARLAWFANDASNASPLPAGAQMGLTMRADSSAGSPQFGVAFTPQLGLRALRRSSAGAATMETATYGAGEVSIQQLGSNYRPLLHYFTGNDFMKGLHESFPGAFSNNFAGFTTDSPYAGYQKWGGSETHPDALKHREKIILYERWLQQRGRDHEFIANSAGGTDFNGFDTSTEAGRDAWDLLYKNQSLRSIQLHQLEGGRPNRVIFESWYVGPFTMVPETKNGSFANLALEGLKYLKGTGQLLDLLVKRADEASFEGAFLYQSAPSGVQRREWRAASASDSTSFTVRLVNRGDVAALPVIHAHETGGAEWTVSYQLGGTNVSSSILSAGGLMVTDAALYSGNELIAPGASVDLTVSIQAATPVQPRDILIRAFWNPQDPSGEVRDSIEIALLPPNSPPVVAPAALATPPSTPVEIDLRTIASDAETADDGLWFGLLDAIGGTVELLADGRTARFTPAEGFSGEASFSFAVRDAFTDYRLLRHFDFEAPDVAGDGFADDRSLAAVPGELVSAGTGAAIYQNDPPAALAVTQQSALRLVEDGTANHAHLATTVPAAEWNLSSNPWTASFWFRRESTGSHDFAFYIGSGNGFSGDGDEFEIFCPANSNSLTLQYWDASNVRQAQIQSAAGSVPASQWHHAAVVWEPTSGSTGSMRLFLNGEPIGAVPFTAAFNQNLPILFGGIRSAAPDPRHFDGLLDDCALFRAALDDAEIARLAAMPVVHNAGRETTGTVQVQVSSFATGLTGQWPFDGNYDDISGNARHLAPAGSATLAGTPVKQGSAAMQATISGSHASTIMAIPLGDGFSISAWIYLPSGASSVRAIAANSASGFNSDGFRFFANTFNTSDGKLIFETGNGTLAALVSSPAGTLAFDRWQHVAATVNRSTGATTLYRNGQPVASGTVRTDFNSNAILTIAAMAGGTNSLRGTIDDLRLHARVIGPTEMSALAALENSPPTIIGPVSFTHPAGSATAELPVTIGDAETPAAQLALTATSSDPLLLPPSSITLGGTAENRTLVLSPVAWRGGSATITLTVDDGLVVSETSFVITVTNPGYPALWTAVLPDADLPWSLPAHWDNSITPWPGAECELDFLTGITVPAGNIHAVQDMAEPFTARRITLGGSGPASGSASLSQQGGGLALVANGAGTPALVLNANGALEHRIGMPVSIATNLDISGEGSGVFEISGTLSGTAGLVKSGNATLALSGDNTYNGFTNIQQGAIRAAHANALGDIANGTTVQGGTARATLELAGDIQIAEPVQFVMHNNADHTQLRNISGENTLAGQISLNSGGGRWDIASLAGSLTLAGPIVNISTGTDTWRTLHLHGPAAGTITGNLSNSASGNSLTSLRVVSGDWTLSGNPKSYTGSTTIEGGVLAVQTTLSSNVTVSAADLRWEQLFEQSPLSIQIFHPDGRTKRYNPAWQKIFGLTDEQAYAFNVLESPDLIESGAIHHIRKAFEGEVVFVPPVPFPVIGRPEQIRWIGGTVFPVITPDGTLHEVVVVHHDITELKEAEETMRRLNEILEERVATRTAELAASEENLRVALDAERQLNQLKTAFVGMVSHEFRTPLGIIQTATELLDRHHDRLRPDQRDQYTGTILAAVRRMTAMMEHILLLARIDSTRRPQPCRNRPRRMARQRPAGNPVHLPVARPLRLPCQKSAKRPAPTATSSTSTSIPRLNSAAPCSTNPSSITSSATSSPTPANTRRPAPPSRSPSPSVPHTSPSPCATAAAASRSTSNPTSSTASSAVPTSAAPQAPASASPSPAAASNC